MSPPRCAWLDGCRTPELCRDLGLCPCWDEVTWEDDVEDQYDDDPAEGWGLSDLGPIYKSADELARYRPKGPGGSSSSDD